MFINMIMMMMIFGFFLYRLDQRHLVNMLLPSVTLY